MNQQPVMNRLEFECWNCHKTFELTVDITGQPQFSKECPYCGQRCSVDLNPYRRSEIEILRGDDINLETETRVLPKTIPTTPAKEVG